MPPLNLDLYFHRSPDGYRVRLDSPMGQTSVDFEPPAAAQEEAQGQGMGPQDVGGRIFRALFNGEAATLLQRNLDRAEAQKTPLRIRLRLNDTPELADLPWEGLHDPERGRFLALSNRCAILRYLEMPDSPRSLVVPDKLHILCVLASPSDLTELNVEDEWAGLNEELSTPIQTGDMVLERLHPPTLDALRRRLRQDPPVHVLHFSGHGLFDAETGGKVVLETAQGRADLVTAEQLAVHLHNTPSLRLTLLNACEGALSGPVSPFTGVAGALIRQGMPGVIAMQQEISDRGGIAFARELYAALVDGLTVDAALTAGRTALLDQGRDEWPIPVLFTRAPDDRLFGDDPGQADRPFTVPFPRNKDFVGRETDLAELHVALQGEGTVGINAGLTGQGGIGKTQLAVEYCFRHRDDYPGGIFWVNAAEEWRQGFAELGRRVQPDCADRPTEQQIQAAARYLRNHPNALLVLDNVDDPARLLRPVIPELIPGDLPGPVLFTTRRRDLGKFQPVEVSVLPPEPALTLLLSHPSRADVRQPHHPEHATAQEICRILGGLPLALEIAAAHLGKRPTQPVAAYRDALLNRGALAVVDDPRIKVKDVDLGTRHAAAVAATLAEQWDLVQSEDARLLLRIAGQLPEAAQIPTARLGLLADISAEDDGFFGSPLAAALDELADISLIEPLADDAIRLHPLVREFAADLTPPDRRDDDRSAWAANLLAGYSRIEILQDYCTHRGLPAVEQDLLAALALLPADAAPVRDDLDALYRILARYGHELRDWQRHNLPAYFAQQIRNRAKGTDLASSADTFLTQQGYSTLGVVWATTYTHPALVRILTGHKRGVNAVAMTPDGQRAVSASDDKTVRVWDLGTGETIATLTGHEASVRFVAMTPDGQRAVSASADGTLRVWDLNTGESIATLSGHKASVRSVAVTPDGRRVVSSSDDQTVRIWDISNVAFGSGQYIAMRIDFDSVVRSVVVTPDGSLVVLASNDQTVQVWDVSNVDMDSGEIVATLTGHESRVRSVAVTPDGQRVVSSSYDRTVRVWDISGIPVDSGNCVMTLRGHKDLVRSVAVTRDGNRAVSASDDRTIRVWDLTRGEAIGTLTGHEDLVMSVAITPDGRRVISASWDGTIRVWDTSSFLREKSDSLAHESVVRSVAVIENGHLAISASDDGTVRVWDISDFHILRGEKRAKLTDHKSWVSSVAVTDNGKQLVSGSDDQTVQVWNLERGERTATLVGHKDLVTSVTMTADGQRAVSASADRTVRVWDLERRKRVAILRGHKDWVMSVAVTPDGRWAVSASDDRTVRIWDLKRRKRVSTLRGHEDGVLSVDITQDGRWAISASNDRTVRMWDLGRRRCAAILKGHEGSVMTVVIMSDRRWAVSASEDRTVRVWNLESAHQLAMIALDGAVQTVAVAPDGRTIVAGDVNGNVYCLTYTPGRGA